MDGRPGDDHLGERSTAGVPRTAPRRRSLHSTLEPTVDRSAPPSLGRKPAAWQVLGAVALFYAAVIVFATWPFCFSCRDTLHALGDPCQHLWIMNWYKSCLLQMKSPFFCDQLQYPLGVPLGLFSPLHLQSALFLPLSIVTQSDVLSYNIIWMIGLVSTGLGIYVLAWEVTGHRAASVMGGMLGLLSGPVMLHAHAHLELLFVGTVALFLAAWIRFLDRPSWGRLVAASACYVLAGSAAAYYIVLTVVPAAVIVAHRLVGLARREGKSAVFGRLRWLAGFVVVTLPFVSLLMANQIWAVAHGVALTRSRLNFVSDGMNAPLWGYFIPSPFHTLASSLMPLQVWEAITPFGGLHFAERCSYLGVVTFFLLHHALIHRAEVRGSRIWWSLLAIVVVLGMGCYTWLGPVRVSLPALWLWETFPPFRLLRLPARFHLLAVIPAAILAALGLARLLGRESRPAVRAALLAALTVVAILDLGQFPYRAPYPLPPMPEGYTWLKRHDAGATMLEWPMGGWGSAERTLWARSHGLRTSEGYSGVANPAFVDRISVLSPLNGMGQPGFLASPLPGSYGPIQDAPFGDYLWLFLKANGYRYLVVNDDPLKFWIRPDSQAILKAFLGNSKVFDDAQMAIFEQERMTTPTRPVLACTEGWRSSMGYHAPLRYGIGKVARVAVFNPTPGAAVELAMDAAACREARTVRLMDGRVELARWKIETGNEMPYVSPPLHLPAEVRELTLESDSESVPRDPNRALDEAKSAYSLRVAAIRLRNVH